VISHREFANYVPEPEPGRTESDDNHANSSTIIQVRSAKINESATKVEALNLESDSMR